MQVVAAADDRKKAEQLFLDTDLDGSGELDAEELKTLMAKIGIDMDLELIEEAINAVGTLCHPVSSYHRISSSRIIISSYHRISSSRITHLSASLTDIHS